MYSSFAPGRDASTVSFPSEEGIGARPPEMELVVFFRLLLEVVLLFFFGDPSIEEEVAFLLEATFLVDSFVSLFLAVLLVGEAEIFLGARFFVETSLETFFGEELLERELFLTSLALRRYEARFG